MATEQLANLASTTLASNYTSGGTSMLVVSSSGFPALVSGEQFHATIFDQTSGLAKLIILVTAISGTTWTTSPESSDTNCSAGDIVRGTILTVGSITQMRADTNQQGTHNNLPSTTGQLAGNRYKCTDAPYEYIFNGTSWQAYVFGYPVTEPTTSGLTTVSAGTGSISTTNGGMLFTAPGNGSTENLMVVGAPLSGAKYVDAAFIINGLNNGNGGAGSGMSAGLLTSSALSFNEIGNYNGSADNIGATSYTSTTVHSAGLAGINTALFLAQGPMIWTRIYDDGTTNRVYYYSTNGYTWTQLYSEARTTLYTATDGVFAVNPFNWTFQVHLLHFSIHS